jgi:hypothetical protein
MTSTGGRSTVSRYSRSGRKRVPGAVYGIVTN